MIFFICLASIDIAVYNELWATLEEEVAELNHYLEHDEYPPETYDRSDKIRQAGYQTLKWRGLYTWKDFAVNTTTMTDHPAKQDVLVGQIFILVYEAIKHEAEDHIGEFVRFTTPEPNPTSA